MTTPAPSAHLVQYAFQRAGCHPRVDLTVYGVERMARTVVARVTLRYHAADPICCAEPACYIPALRPDGLAAICHQLRAEELDPELKLQVVVTFSLEPGFRFREPALGCADGTEIIYSYPPPELSADSCGAVT